MNGKTTLAIVLGVLASSLIASRSEAQYRYIGGAPYFGGAYAYPSYGPGSTYSIGSVVLYGAGMPYGIGTYGGFLQPSPYFGGLGSVYGYGQGNDLINSLYGYSSPVNYGTATLPASGGFGSTPVEGLTVTDPNVIEAGDTGIAAVPSGISPTVPSGVPVPVAPSAVVATRVRPAYVVNGPTGLKDSIDITKPTGTQVKISWSGNPSTIKQMTFSILDSTKHVIDSQDITAMPAQATFTKRRRSAYYRIFIQYLDGATRTLTAPL